MDNVSRISTGLRNGEYTTTPYQCAHDRSILAGEYAFVLGQLEQILQKKPSIWSDMRKNFKSDKACERSWEATSDGISEAGLRLRARSIEKMMTALGSLIRIAEGESKNLM